MENSNNSYTELLNAINGIRQDVAVLNSQFEEFKNRTAKVDNIENDLIKLTVDFNNLKDQVKTNNSRTWGIISGLIVGVGVALIKLFVNI